MESTTDYHVPQDFLTATDLHTEAVYAGFWLRLVAFLIDLSILVIATTLANILFFYNFESISLDIDFAGFFIVFIYCLYIPLAESSSWQGTLGKKALSMKVTSLKGEKISFIIAIGRFFTKMLSLTVLLGTGCIMAAFNKKKQALHDITSHTLVVMK